MKLDDFRRLKALMNRTFSDSDPEALAAIRAANRILQSEGLTWERVLNRTVTVIDAVEDDPAWTEPGKYPRAGGNRLTIIEPKMIADLLEEARQAALRQSKSAQSFVNSIAEQWAEKGFITAAQSARLREIRDR